MNWLKKNWTKHQVKALKLSVFLLFGFGLAFFLLFACSKRKPTEQPAANNKPQFLPLSSRALQENERVSFGLIAFDVDGAIPALSVNDAPKNAIFTDSANGRGSFDWKPTFSQEGNYTLRFIASDGQLADTEQVVITVGNVNRPPTLQPVDTQFFVEGVLGGFSIRGIDPDGDFLSLFADSLPQGAALVDSANGRGGVFWGPDFTQAGDYRAFFIVSDRFLAESQRVTLRVLDFDRAPSFSPANNQEVVEGQLLAFAVSADDPDGSTIQFSVQGLPSGAIFTDSANGRGGFRWLTKVFQAGTYNLIFTARSGALADTQIVTVRVDTALITYTNHVKTILDTRCTPCHFPGGALCGSICFNTYAGAFQRRDRIRIRVTAGTMPPVPGGLPQGKRDTINAWVVRGAPQ